MDDALNTAVEELAAAVRSHAEAAQHEPESAEDDRLPEATHRLLAAIHGYTDQLRESTNVWVPWDVPEMAVTPEDELFADDMALEVIGRWRYVIPSVERLLDYVDVDGDRLEGRPELAIYELLHAKEHPLRWIAEDVLQFDRATVGIFEASDGGYIEGDLPDAVRPETEVLFGYTDHPRFATEEEAREAARAHADAVNADPGAGTATVREDQASDGD